MREGGDERRVCTLRALAARKGRSEKFAFRWLILFAHVHDADDLGQAESDAGWRAGKGESFANDPIDSVRIKH